MASDALASIAVFSISAVMTGLPQFLPKLTDVHHASSDSSFAVDVRLGEVVTVAFFVSVGIIASSIAGSPDPFMAAIIMALFLVVAYEAALRNNFGVEVTL